MKIPGGGFHGLGDGAWTDFPPAHRSDLTVSQLADLLRLEIDRAAHGDDRDSGELAAAYGYADAQGILSDLHLSCRNEIRRCQDQAAFYRTTGASAKNSLARVRTLVILSGRRTTLNVSDLRKALDPDDRE